MNTSGNSFAISKFKTISCVNCDPWLFSIYVYSFSLPIEVSENISRYSVNDFGGVVSLSHSSFNVDFDFLDLIWSMSYRLHAQTVENNLYKLVNSMVHVMSSEHLIQLSQRHTVISRIAASWCGWVCSCKLLIAFGVSFGQSVSEDLAQQLVYIHILDRVLLWR